MEIRTTARTPNIDDDLDAFAVDLAVDHVADVLPSATPDNITAVPDFDSITVDRYAIDPGTGETLAEVTVPVYGYMVWVDVEAGGTVYAICLDCREGVAVDPDNGIPDVLAAWSRHGSTMDMDAGFGGGTCAAVEYQYRRAAAEQRMIDAYTFGGAR